MEPDVVFEERKSAAQQIDADLDPPDPTRLCSRRITNICAALNKAQSQTKEVIRDQEGFMPTKSGGYKYMYAGLDRTCGATKDAQAENGLSVFSPIEGNHLRFFLLHVSGEWLNYGLWPLHGDHQTIGGGMTYGRRYQEGNIYKVSPQDDDDARGASERFREKAEAQRESQPPRQASRPQQRRQQGKRDQQPAQEPSKGQLLIPPPDWPDTTVDELHKWIDSLESSATMQFACGLLFGQESPIGNIQERYPLCKHLHEKYHAKLATATAEQQQKLAQITQEIDKAWSACELDMQSVETFQKDPPEGATS